MDRPATIADLEIFGMQLGIQCAQRILRGYADSPLKPDPSRETVLLFFAVIENDFVTDQRVTNGMTDAGEAAYRKGVRRGLKSQLDNPEAKIEIKGV